MNTPEFNRLQLSAAGSAIATAIVGALAGSLSNARADPSTIWAALISTIILVFIVYPVVFRSQCNYLVLRFGIVFPDNERPILDMLLINLSRYHALTIGRISITDEKGFEIFVPVTPEYFGNRYAARYPDRTRSVYKRAPIELAANGDALILELLPAGLTIPEDCATHRILSLYTNRGLIQLLLPWSSDLHDSAYLLYYRGHPAER